MGLRLGRQREDGPRRPLPRGRRGRRRRRRRPLQDCGAGSAVRRRQADPRHRRRGGEGQAVRCPGIKLTKMELLHFQKYPGISLR